MMRSVLREDHQEDNRVETNKKEAKQNKGRRRRRTIQNKKKDTEPDDAVSMCPEDAQPMARRD